MADTTAFNSEERDEKNMTTSHATPASLAGVASARTMSQPGSALLGTGLETRGVHAWFGKKHVLSDISLDFAAGTVTALIGPSGCGKSTFIRTLNRMHEFIPTAAMAGEVLLDGKDVYAPGTDVTKIRLRVGMVFQKPNPFPSMTIGENVLSGLKLAQIKRSDTDDLLESCLTRAGLWNEVKDRLGEHGGALSGGQQQRLCIARSLAVDVLSQSSITLRIEITNAVYKSLLCFGVDAQRMSIPNYHIGVFTCSQTSCALIDAQEFRRIRGHKLQRLCF